MKKRLLAMIGLVLIVLALFVNIKVTAADGSIPTVTISGISSGLVLEEGGTLTFKVYFDDDTELASTYLPASSIITNGFTATKTVTGGTTKTVTLSNIKGAGSGKYITIAAGAATDSSGNVSKAVDSRTFTIKATDSTPPSVTVSKPNPTSVYIGGTITYTVYFDDETGIKAVNFNKDYIVLNGFAATVSVSGTGTEQRTVTLTNVQGASDSENYITIKSGAAIDAAGNISKAVTSAKFTMSSKPVVDGAIPTITISKADQSSVNIGGTVRYTVYFDDDTGIKLVNFNKDYVVLNGFTATVSVSGSGNTRVVTLTNVQGEADSDNSITVKAGAAIDTSGNVSKAVTSAVFTMTKKDTKSPQISTGGPTPNKIYAGETVRYIITITDEEGIEKFNLSEEYIVLHGFTADVKVTGTGNYKRGITLSNVQGKPGADKYITIKAGAAVDTSGNKTAETACNKFEILANTDKTIPTVTISKPNPSTAYIGDTVTYTVYFDDETGIKAVNFNKDYVTLNGFSATVSVSGTGTEKRTVTLSNVQGAADADNSITVKAGAVTDTSGNNSQAVTSVTFTMVKKDTTPPTVAISKPNPSTVYIGDTVTYTVYFDDETGIKTVNFNKDYVVLNGFTANVSVTGTGIEQRTVTLTNVQGAADSDNSITVKAGAVTDTSGNNSKAITSSTFIMIKKDTTPPVISVEGPTPNKIYAGETVTYTVHFTDDDVIRAINLNKDYVVLNGFNADISITGSGVSKRVITLSNIKGAADSDNYITIKAGAAVDVTGNTTKSVTSNKFDIMPVPDKTAPTVTIYKANPASIYAGETVKYIVRFSDETKLGKIHFDSSYVILNGFTANVSVSGEGETRLVTLTNVQGTPDSNNSITVKAGAAEDAAGNKTGVANSLVFTIKERQENKDTISPIVKISSPDPKSVYSGGTVTYKVTFSDNIKVTDVNLAANKIELVGFTADISVKVDGVKSAIITLKNIRGNVGVNKYIKIDSGVALDEPGNRSAKVVSSKFEIAKNESEDANKQPVVTQYKVNCIDDLKLLGDINEEITYFASWLRAEKYTATHVQENNYAAEDETMTYMIDYYNGSTTIASNVSFNLTIPYKVDIEELNGNGKITKRTDDETVITWNMGNVQSYVASTGTGFCRLYVRVRFLENEALEKSENISEVFYATLKTTSNETDTYSYMRQLFIDTTEGKTGTYKKYLTMVDTINEARPDDEITRAEFAKLLADTGLLKIEIGSDKYKMLKDSETIPAYARDAVSALVQINAIRIFSDETFRPNNPLLREEAMEILANVAAEISEQKLKVYKPVFLYTDALVGKDEKVSPKKDYIMELMRQNVIVKYDSNPDSYTLRKDAVEMVNSLTFRGPFVETLPENTLKFADIRDNSVFFYNIVGASNAYKYTYDYRLWQQIVEVE